MSAKTFNQDKLIIAAGVYFLACGVSATFYPALWYQLAGLEVQSLDLTLAIVGVMMSSLGLGAFLTTSTKEERLILKLFLFANSADVLVVVFYTLWGVLPEINGLSFVAIDLTWIALLSRCYFSNIAKE